MNGLSCRLATIVLIGATLIAGLSSCTGVNHGPPHPIKSALTMQSSDHVPIHGEGGFAHEPSQPREPTDHALLDPHRIEPGQVCVINANMEETKILDQFANDHGYTKKKRRVLEGLGFVMSILQVPQGETVSEGIRELREEFPSQMIDANHHYDLHGGEHGLDPRRYGQQIVGWTAQAVTCPGENLRIGMVDTSVDVGAPFFHKPSIHTQSFLSETTPQAPRHHGTAVAIQLVGQSPQAGSGLLPNATLFVAEAFRHVHPGRVEATTWSIVRALDWLAKEQVQVINLSLGGPPNALLTYAIEQTLDRNIALVASAGNTGPHGPPMYPAAQDGVIAVTALDAKLIPYHYGSRGSHLTFSAPGVDIWVPTGKESGVFKSGTSFAAPFVTTAVAAMKLAHPQATPADITHYLSAQALDLGPKGKDDVFGWGLIQIPQGCEKSSTPSST